MHVFGGDVPTLGVCRVCVRCITVWEPVRPEVPYTAFVTGFYCKRLFYSLFLFSLSSFLRKSGRVVLAILREGVREAVVKAIARALPNSRWGSCTDNYVRRANPNL